jgi:hypothetical protein
VSSARGPGIFRRKADTLHEFPNLDAGERRLWAQC